MQTLVLMRYSYFGASGWKSDASRELDALLAPERLTKRAELLEKIALPSLAAQTDPDFKLVILAARDFPKWRKKQLRDLCFDALGEDRVKLLFRGPGLAHAKFRAFIQKSQTDDPVTCQVVLDDDDALARDFLETLKPEAESTYQLCKGERPYTFLSYSRGLTLKLSDAEPELIWRNSPFTNLGLALVSSTSERKSVFGVAHKRVAERHPARVIYSPVPSYVRTIHDINDSHAQHGKKRVVPEDMPDILARFRFLHRFFPQYAQKEQDVRAA